MKVGFLDYSLVDRSKPGTGGLSDLIWDAVKGLVAFNDEVHIAGPYRTDKFPVRGVHTYQYNISDFWFRNIYTQMAVIYQGGNKLKKVKNLQLIHVPEYLSSTLLTYQFPHLPIVLTTPGNIFERLTKFNPYDPMTTSVYKWAARQSANRCAAIIATSRDMASWWSYSGADPSKIFIVPLAVNTDLFYPRDGVKEQLGWSKDKFHMLFVGRMAAENRVDLLLECMAFLAKVPGYKFHLHIVGNGPLKEQYVKVAQQAGIGESVTWHGSVVYNDLPTYYSACDLFVFPRPTGAPPRVIPQAMACGAPVVSVSNVNAVDYIEEGHTGILSEAVNGLSLGSTILRAVRDNEKLLVWGKNSATYARENFSISVVMHKIRTEVYYHVLKNFM